mmetsp:Transcript_14937/g.28273  ORF Transcript_14937/g.28273 Transcript_14937/m.28273 type:complete len:473 (-) Transcript_14937:86-1504(-)|eukprot:scaffold34597_cov177-Amphora_coffeaeformis.AAC.11
MGVSGNPASTRHRLAEWNQKSKGRSSCNADYFSVGNKPKIRVEVTENPDYWEKVLDNHTVLNAHHRRPPRFGPLTMTMCCSTVIIMVWYMKIARGKKACLPTEETKETTVLREVVSASSSQTSLTKPMGETCPKGIPCLMSEQSTSFLREARYQPIDPSRIKRDPVHYEHNLSVSKLPLDGGEVKHLAAEVTSATDVALQTFKMAGHQVEAKDLIPSITQLVISSLERTEKKQQESRRYLFEASQNQINREEAAAVHREDSQWMDRVRKGCNELVEEVERVTIRVVLIECCGQSGLWVLSHFKTTSSLAGLANAVAHIICASCSIEQRNLVLSASLYASNMMPQSTCWLSCGCRCLVVALGSYTALQLRRLLPNIVREVFGIFLFGTGCFMAVSMDLISMYWYCFLVLVALGYLGAHWQFFSTKRRLQKGFPGKNPSGYAVNQALDALETHRRVYAIVPLAFVAIHVIGLLG